MASVIDVKYNLAKDNKSDINEHIPVLYEYSKNCNIIVEMGVRSCVSTWAFVKALFDNKNDNKNLTPQLIGVDLVYHNNIDIVKNICDKNNINYTFIQGDSAKVDLTKYSIDLLFIDTWHVYAHLKRELAKHANLVNKYIILHDTTVDAIKGESIRCGLDIKQQAIDTGYLESEITEGLWPAVEEFLANNKDWVLHKRLTNCNGLTILKRLKFNP